MGEFIKISTLFKAIDANLCNLPPPRSLAGYENILPHVIVADAAFPLTEYIMKPYAQRLLTKESCIFNYRLSRARRIVENAFGILTNRFRIFLSPMLLSPENVEKITLASCV